MVVTLIPGAGTAPTADDVIGALRGSADSAARSATTVGEDLVAQGEDLFFNGTFDGNGRLPGYATRTRCSPRPACPRGDQPAKATICSCDWSS